MYIELDRKIKSVEEIKNKLAQVVKYDEHVIAVNEFTLRQIAISERNFDTYETRYVFEFLKATDNEERLFFQKRMLFFVESERDGEIFVTPIRIVIDSKIENLVMVVRDKHVYDTYFDMKYLGNELYQISLDNYLWTFPSKNIEEAKKWFLNDMSERFDDFVNEKMEK